jgi:hypothetical protein
VAAALLALPSPLIVAAIAVTALSLGYDMTQPLLAGIVTQLAPDRPGHAMGLNVFCFFTGFGLGSLLFELLCETASLPRSFSLRSFKEHWRYWAYFSFRRRNHQPRYPGALMISNISTTAEAERFDVRQPLRCLIPTIALIAGAATALHGSGHGPVFGMSTPTNVKGRWSLDLGLMGRAGEQNRDSMVRAMLGYGITEDLQLSLSVPSSFTAAPLAPSRITGMMPASMDLEAIGSYRSFRKGTRVGTREHRKCGTRSARTTAPGGDDG